MQDNKLRDWQVLLGKEVKHSSLALSDLLTDPQVWHGAAAAVSRSDAI